ncbi:MAG: hypothetical protein ACYTBJ_22535 [Planctomycetota bacterium]|jgi:hypothetical protein
MTDERKKPITSEELIDAVKDVCICKSVDRYKVRNRHCQVCAAPSPEGSGGLENYPNLRAIMDLTISGKFRDWFLVRDELKAFISQSALKDAERVREVQLVENGLPYDAVSVNGRGMEWKVPLWEGIHLYVRSCGGDPGKGIGDRTGGDRRMEAVCDVENAVERAMLLAVELLAPPLQDGERGAMERSHRASEEEEADHLLLESGEVRIGVTEGQQIYAYVHEGAMGVGDTVSEALAGLWAILSHEDTEGEGE